MRLKRLLDRRAINSLAALGLLLGTVAPAALPAFASAAQLSSRSITMSTSAVSAAGASYDLKFTGTTAIGATASDEGGIIIDFCSNSAVLSDSCTAPNGMDVDVSSSLGVTGVTYGGSAAGSNGTITGDNNHIKWTAGSAYAGSGATFEMTITGITNPTDAGVFYARVTTYTSKTHFDTYTSATAPGTYDDEGSVALAATPGIGITSYVLESMSFCVSLGSEHGVNTDAPSENCGSNESGGCSSYQSGCVVAPSMTLGQQIGTTGQYALDSGNLSTGSVYAQLSSNATGGTVINLKSDAVGCGGLYLNGVNDGSNCHISPKTTAGAIAAGQANFGLEVGTPAVALAAGGGAGSGSGTGNIVNDGSYNGSTFYMNFVDANSGVTSTYGDKIFHATGAVDNVNVPVTFGASISNTTPAGVYGATLSLIAVGTF